MTLAEGNGYHAVCAKGLFGSETAPTFAYSMAELNEFAKRLVLSHVSVPGVQAKLSVHLERAEHTPDRLTLVGLDGNYILKWRIGVSDAADGPRRRREAHDRLLPAD